MPDQLTLWLAWETLHADAHKYQPADFGLHTADMTRSFDRYRTRFIT